MNPNVILLPVLAQVALTLMMFIRLGVAKTKARKAGTVDVKKAALHHDVWPDDVLKISNNISNQFETPILFYVLALVFHLMDAVSLIVLGAAWAYVISRYIHAYIHTGSNYVPWRFRFFLVGALILLCLTAVASVQLLMML